MSKPPLIIMSYNWSLAKDTSISNARGCNLDRDVYIACYDEKIYQRLARVNDFKLIVAEERFPCNYMGKRNAILSYCRRNNIPSFYLLEDCLAWTKVRQAGSRLYNDVPLRQFLLRADSIIDEEDPDVMSFFNNAAAITDESPSGFYTVFTYLNLRIPNEHQLWFYDDQFVYDDDIMYYLINWLGGRFYKPKDMLYHMSAQFQGIKDPNQNWQTRRAVSNQVIKEIIGEDVEVMADQREAWKRFTEPKARRRVCRNIDSYFRRHKYNG